MPPAESCRQFHPNPPHRLLMTRHQETFRFFKFVEDAQATGQIRLALIGQRQPTRRAMDKLGAKALLDARHGFPDGAACYAQEQPRRSEASFLSRSNELSDARKSVFLHAIMESKDEVIGILCGFSPRRTKLELKRPQEVDMQSPLQLRRAQTVASLARQPAYTRLFAQNKLTVGLILPLETHPTSPAPTMRDHVAMAQKAEQLGFAALWMRDVPFYDPDYGDVGQVFDPLVYIAYLSAFTRHIALGTAGIVLPMREPLILAKQVASLDQLSGGRMVIGLSSGDRPAEYPFFGIDFETRGDRFRDAFSVYRTVIEQSFPHFSSPRFGRGEGTLDLVPKPAYERTPTLAIGRAQQNLGWIAENTDGFIGASPTPELLPQFASQWHAHVRELFGPEHFKPLGIAGYLDLVDDANEPLRRTRGGFRSGSKSLAQFLHEAEAAGVSHIALNPKISRRPYAELMDELASEVLPHFPSH